MEIQEATKPRQAGEVQLDSIRADKKTNLGKGNRLICHIYTAIKAAQLYDPGNEGFTSQFDKLMNTFTDLFGEEDSISLEVYMHCLFFNRVKIKSEFQNYLHTRFIIDTLKSRDTEGLFFTPGLKKEELSEFILLLASREKQERITFEEFESQLMDHQIEHISIHQFSATTKRAAKEKLMSIRRQAKRTFFESIYNLKGIMFKGKSEQRICTRRVRRLVQSIVDLIAEDEPYLTGLTTMKDFDHSLLNHSVNVCILSVALGQRLQLDRDALKELALAGLFHDIGKISGETPIDSDDPTSGEPWSSPDKHHPIRGVERIIEMKGLGVLPVRAMKAILEHHLNFDRSGYPNLTQRDLLDLFSRIITIANHFETATRHQPGHLQDRTQKQVLLDMISESGTRFDPGLLRLFIYMVGLYPAGSLVALDTGELGVVLQPNIDPALTDRPTVQLIGDRSGTKLDGEIVDLTEEDPGSGAFMRSIIKDLDHRCHKVDIFSLVSRCS